MCECCMGLLDVCSGGWGIRLPGAVNADQSVWLYTKTPRVMLNLTGKIDLVFQKRDINAKFKKNYLLDNPYTRNRFDFLKTGSECQIRKIYLLDNSDLIGKIRFFKKWIRMPDLANLFTSQF